MASYMLVRHRVKDFAAWKRGYDEHSATRNAAGLTEKYLLHSDEDPNEVAVMFEAADPERARAFAGSDDLREKMQQVGVIDKPDILFLHD